MTTTRKKTSRPAARPRLQRVPAPRVRWSRVQTARSRIAAGFYEREDIQGAVAEAVLRDLTRR